MFYSGILTYIFILQEKNFKFALLIITKLTFMKKKGV